MLYMKTKLVLLSALLGLSINAASAEVPAIDGSLGLGFTSKDDRRGSILSTDALQGTLGLSSDLGVATLNADFLTSFDSADTGSDTNELTVGLNREIIDGLAGTLGLYNTDIENGESSLELLVSLQYEVPNLDLDSSLTYYRDVDDEYETLQVSLGCVFDLDVVDLGVAGILGQTEDASTQDRDYHGVSATATKSLNDRVNVYADVALTDSDVRDSTTQWGIGVNLNF